MGLSASQGRLLDLTVRKDFFSFQMQQIDEERMQIANQTEKLFQEEEIQSNYQAPTISFNDIYNAASNSFSNSFRSINLDPQNIFNNLTGIFSSNKSNNANNNINMKIYELEEQDKKLQMRLDIDNTQYNAATKEIDMIKKEISQDIKSTFNVLG